MTKQYGNRNAIALDAEGGYYIRHIVAMTRERLHDKAAIALELAWRDAQIDRLKRELADLKGNEPCPWTNA